MHACGSSHTCALAPAITVAVATTRGNISIGSGTVVHPRAIIHALGGGEIEIGTECIIEEFAQIVHRDKGKMVIGDRNLFEAGCRECKREGHGGGRHRRAADEDAAQVSSLPASARTTSLSRGADRWSRLPSRTSAQ